MQVSTAWMFLSMAAVYESWLLVAAVLILVFYSEIFARWHHQLGIESKFGNHWLSYKQEVRNWWPRWEPFVAADAEPDEAYFSRECGICQETERIMRILQPKQVDFLCASTHPERDLERAAYRYEQGRCEDVGVSVVMRILERVNLSLAFIAGVLRLPVISWFVQTVVDGLGLKGEKVIRKSNTKK